MAIFKDRFASEDLLQLFVFCAFPIHVWAIVNVLRDVPSWALYLRTSELIGTVAYNLTFALFETLIILVPFVVLGMLIPKRWVSEYFVPWVGVITVGGAIAAISFQNAITSYSPKKLLVAAIITALGVSTILVIRFPKIRNIVRQVGKRLIILSLLYLFLDLIGVVIVVVRNL